MLGGDFRAWGVHPGFGPDVDCNYSSLLSKAFTKVFIRVSARMWIAIRIGEDEILAYGPTASGSAISS